MKWIEVEFQGRTRRVPVLKHQGKLWFHWQGETRMLDVSSGGQRSSAAAAAGKPGVLVAPMPGKITRVSVRRGESVTKGQALIVMEAMKMEYTLECDVEGEVTELNVAVGEQVSLGDVLVRVKDK